MRKDDEAPAVRMKRAVEERVRELCEEVFEERMAELMENFDARCLELIRAEIDDLQGTRTWNE